MRAFMKDCSPERLAKRGFDCVLCDAKDLAFTNYSIAGQTGHLSGLDSCAKNSWRVKAPPKGWDDLKILTYADFKRARG